MAVTTLVSILPPSIGLNQVPWNELDLPDFTMIERVYLLVCIIASLEYLDHTSLSGVGPSTEVEYTHTRSLVDDDDFTDDDELDVPHDYSSDFDCDSEDPDNQPFVTYCSSDDSD
ncbi:hypothetical protein Tco_0465732 [Tanacetum coccineum]